jgi:hypothetical protein
MSEEPPAGAFDALFAVSTRSGSLFASDSGTVKIVRRFPFGWKGSFRVFVSDSITWQPGPRRQLLVVGHFVL